MKKKIAALGLATIMASTILTGCTNSNKETLRFGVAISYPPFEYYDSDNITAAGFDIDLANEIASRIGMETEFVDKAWDDIFDGLKKDEYDCIISAVTITDARKEEFDFSISYIQNYQCIVSLKDSENKPSSPDELKNLSVCFQRGTTSEAYIADYMAANNIECATYGYSLVNSCFEELALNRVDAVLVDSTVASCYCNDADSIYEITWQQTGTPEEFGIVIPKSNPELTEKINSALEEIKADGTIDQLIDKYF